MSQNTTFQKCLHAWYLKNHRDLPWRKTKDIYAIWVSEVMLQQTRVDTAISYYLNFLSVFPTLQDLAKAPLERVLKLWEGLGYYARCRNLHKAAQFLVNTNRSQIPTTWEGFRMLPGVGEYIAAAVLSISLNQPYAVVDGNVKRVYARLLCENTPINSATSHVHYQKIADRYLFKSHPSDWNQALMELGALICTPTSPNCTICPVSKICKSYLKNKVKEFPKRLQTAKIPTYFVSIGVVLKNGKILITRRKEDGFLGGLWEFPGGKRKTKESAEMACVREIKEECKLDVNIESYLMRVKHAYTHFKVDIDVFICRYQKGRIWLKSATAHAWVSPNQLHKYPFPKANHLFMRQLFSYLQKNK